MKSKLLIVDASVFGKWFLQDEQDRENALLIQQDYDKEHISLALPYITLIEVNNLLKSATLRKRITENQALQIYTQFLNFDFSVHTSDLLLEATLERAITWNISSYDASYVVLAERLQIPFYTADEQLVKKADSDYVFSLQKYTVVNN